MKKFLFKSGLLSFIILLIHFVLAQFADGYSDPYYLKLSSQKQTALILGASRANEGIIPSVIDSVLKTKNQQKGFFNFAFTDSDSPYGSVYLNAIKNKIKENTINSAFILSVHPYSISTRNNETNDELQFRENNLALGSIQQFNGHPNYDYLLNAYDYGWGNLLLKKIENKTFDWLGQKKILNKGTWAYVHEDGWLEVKFLSKDSLFFYNKAEQKLKQVKKSKTYFSSLRYSYLRKIINELLKHGKVYLVRMPVDKKNVEFETKLMPNFDELMNDLAKQNNVEYYSFFNQKNDYKFSDGSHFTKSSAIKFSEKLGEIILKN